MVRSTQNSQRATQVARAASNDEEMTINSESTQTAANLQGSRATRKNRVNVQEKYTKVQHKSANRRKKVKKTRNTGSGQNNNTTTYAYKTRITQKLTVPASANMTASLVNTIKTWLNHLDKGDNKAAVLPWKASDSLEKHLKDGTTLPRDINGLKTYFFNFFLKEENKEVAIYPSVYLGHSKPLDDIVDSMEKSGFLGKKHQMYRKMLQEEDVKEIGWFQFSTREMDRGALKDQIEAELKVDVGLKWKNIDTGARGKIREEDKVQAVHVECKTSKAYATAKVLQTFYSTNQKDRSKYPNGLRLRFIKHISQCLNYEEKGKVKQIRERQKAFLKAVRTTSTDDIVDLDYNPKANQPTLRQMVMGINSVKQEGKPLFLNVDLNYNGTCHILQYAVVHQDEGACTASTLLPLLEHFFPDADVEKLFSQEARDRCRDYEYDVNKGMVVDKNSQQEGDDDELLGFSLELDLTQMEQEMRPSERASMPYDDDTISTFGGTLPRPQKKRRAKAPSRPDDGSTLSHGSSVTMSTIQTLENRVEAVQQEMKDTLRMQEQKAEERYQAMMLTLQGLRRDDNPNSSGTNTGGAGAHAGGQS